MEVSSLTKFARVSPKKANEVARVLRGRPADEALELLRFIPRKSARLLYKTLHSAIANAENNHNLNASDLRIKRAVANEGPAFRRFKPAARGSAKPIRKRTTHLYILLSDEQPEAVEASKR